MNTNDSAKYEMKSMNGEKKKDKNVRWLKPDWKREMMFDEKENSQDLQTNSMQLFDDLENLEPKMKAKWILDNETNHQSRKSKTRVEKKI